MIRMLIVEDDPMVAKFNRMYAEKVENFEVAGVVENVDQAWTFLNENTVDLILLDVYMNQTNGLDMLRDIRKNETPVDVIIITAADDNASVQTALRYGAVDYLIKPFEFERFQESLKQYRRQREMMGQESRVSQKDLDPFLLHEADNSAEGIDLPKGLTGLTLSHITEAVLAAPAAFSAADIAETAGISRVSVRKYLHYLTEKGLIEADVKYQPAGRPQFRYRVPPNKKERLKNLH
ncbi:response regulator [Salibacterium halotolerans]|uniref:Two-component system, CitB family, response regulator MalR n=1 Tax=Salibacterium halotolerans TaxID=1884432 RepID=A0A1I5LF84_9BACI|nr:response regulator [Salibacterium halotolerans]SFO96029.1 two-component system, CitB family, response regulator MalR [Salibacterium halotolerans]